MPEIALRDFNDDNESSIAPGNIGNITPATNQGYQNEENKARLRGRKGHSKSRTGCYNCKRARIKVCILNGQGLKLDAAKIYPVQRESSIV